MYTDVCYKSLSVSKCRNRYFVRVFAINRWPAAAHSCSVTLKTCYLSYSSSTSPRPSSVTALVFYMWAEPWSTTNCRSSGGQSYETFTSKKCEYFTMFTRLALDCCGETNAAPRGSFVCTRRGEKMEAKVVSTWQSLYVENAAHHC